MFGAGQQPSYISEGSTKPSGLISLSFAPDAVVYPLECALGLVLRIGMSVENINHSSNRIIKIPGPHKQFGLLNLVSESWRKDAGSRKVCVCVERSCEDLVR